MPTYSRPLGQRHSLSSSIRRRLTRSIGLPLTSRRTGSAGTVLYRWAKVMRVIAGEFRSRRLKTLPGLDTRPTPDRLREALFSILQLEIEDAIFIDAYAGTGAVGIEALS